MGVILALAALGIAVLAHRRAEPDRRSVLLSLAALAGGLLLQCAIWFALPAGGGVLVAGLALQAAPFALATGQRSHPAALRLVGALVLVESGSVLSKIARSYLILRALDVEPSLLQVTALATAAIAAVLVGFFPGGLGLSEVLSGAISPLVGLPVTIGVLTTAPFALDVLRNRSGH